MIPTLIKSLIKSINNIAKNWISKLSPNIPMKTLIIKIQDNKKPQGTILFLLTGGRTHCFTILFSYSIDSQLPQLRTQLCPTKKTPKVPHKSYFFILGSFSNRKKRLIHINYTYYNRWLRHG